MLSWLLGSKLQFDLVNLLVINLKGFSQDVVWHGGCCREKRRRDDLGTRQLAIEGGDHRRELVAVVLLEMDEALGEQKDLTCMDCRGDQFVCRGDEAHFQFALQHEYNLRGTGVRVRRVKPTIGRKVDARQRHPQCVEARNL